MPEFFICVHLYLFCGLFSQRLRVFLKYFFTEEVQISCKIPRGGHVFICVNRRVLCSLRVCPGLRSESPRQVAFAGFVTNSSDAAPVLCPLIRVAVGY